MSDSKTLPPLTSPKPIVVGKPKFLPGEIVCYNYQSLHLVSRVIYAKFVENISLGDRCEWQYSLEGNPQGLLPERLLFKA